MDERYRFTLPEPVDELVERPKASERPVEQPPAVPVDRLKSPCCKARIFASLGDGVLQGTCADCSRAVVRRNPKTGVQEWLDGKSPWTTDACRPVAEPPHPSADRLTPEQELVWRAIAADYPSRTAVQRARLRVLFAEIDRLRAQVRFLGGT